MPRFKPTLLVSYAAVQYLDHELNGCLSELVVWRVTVPLRRIRGNGVISGQGRWSDQSPKEARGAPETDNKLLTYERRSRLSPHGPFGLGS
jgi:hypothetical protein